MTFVKTTVHVLKLLPLGSKKICGIIKLTSVFFNFDFWLKYSFSYSLGFLEIVRITQSTHPVSWSLLDHSYWALSCPALLWMWHSPRSRTHGVLHPDMWPHQHCPLHMHKKNTPKDSDDQMFRCLKSRWPYYSGRANYNIKSSDRPTLVWFGSSWQSLPLWSLRSWHSEAALRWCPTQPYHLRNHRTVAYAKQV